MSKKTIHRFILILAGILTVTVILLSQSYYHVNAEDSQNVKTEKSESGKGQFYLKAPADIVPQGSAVELNKNEPTVIQSLISGHLETDVIVFTEKRLTKFLKNLFRIIIAPNAP